MPRTCRLLIALLLCCPLASAADDDGLEI